MDPLSSRAERVAKRHPLFLGAWPCRHSRALAWEPVERCVLGVDRPDQRRLARVRHWHVRLEPLDRRVVTEMEQIHDRQPGSRGESSGLRPQIPLSPTGGWWLCSSARERGADLAERCLENSDHSVEGTPGSGDPDHRETRERRRQ